MGINNWVVKPIRWKWVRWLRVCVFIVFLVIVWLVVCIVLSFVIIHLLSQFRTPSYMYRRESNTNLTSKHIIIIIVYKVRLKLLIKRHLLPVILHTMCYTFKVYSAVLILINLPLCGHVIVIISLIVTRKTSHCDIMHSTWHHFSGQ